MGNESKASLAERLCVDGLCQGPPTRRRQEVLIDV